MHNFGPGCLASKHIDMLSFGCDVPRGFQAAMFCLDTAGKLHELGPLDVSPVGAFDHVRYPAKGLWPVQGPPGTVLVFVCANKQHKPRLEEVQKLLQEIENQPQRGTAALPDPKAQVIFLLTSEEVQVVGEIPRGSSLIRDRLESLRGRLRERFGYVWGVALPQR